MIKIIQYGQKHRVTCPECESILEYDRSDIKSIYVKHNDYDHYIICPVCLERIYVVD